MVGARSGWVALPTPRNIMNVKGFPITPCTSSPNARLKPKATQTRLITPRATKLCSIVEMTFRVPTMPP